MKFSILQQDLLPTLQAVSRSVGVRSTLPILDNILLSIEGEKLKVAATNLEIGVIKYLAVEVGTAGEITVPAKTLTDIISGLGPSKVDIEVEGELLTIHSGKFKATINGITASEFPSIPISQEAGISFPKGVFASLSQILFAAAINEGRPVLTGILMDQKDGDLGFVATDGFRLAHLKLKIENKTPQFRSLIPKKTFEEILRIIAEQEVDNISISTSIGQNQAIFTLGSTIVSSRLIEGIFPAWEKIIPAQFVSRVVLDKEAILKGIKLASVFAKNEASVIVVNPKKGGLFLQSSAKELGSQENEIEAEVEGEDLQIAFNAKFLQDAISNSSSSQIMLEFSGALSAAQIKPVGVEGLEYIVMPVRLS
ncbi:DNA polymerase III subunit beta [Candidatus Daviesbacteria bacterium]|nr:DNA polymerase III subunit beta [Candidatus Daviesbacteria bacterium]